MEATEFGLRQASGKPQATGRISRGHGMISQPEQKCKGTRADLSLCLTLILSLPFEERYLGPTPENEAWDRDRLRFPESAVDVPGLSLAY